MAVISPRCFPGSWASTHVLRTAGRPCSQPGRRAAPRGTASRLSDSLGPQGPETSLGGREVRRKEGCSSHSASKPVAPTALGRKGACERDPKPTQSLAPRGNLHQRLCGSQSPPPHQSPQQPPWGSWYRAPRKTITKPAQITGIILIIRDPPPLLTGL